MSWNTNLVQLANLEPPPFHSRALSKFSWWKSGLYLTGEKEIVKDASIDLSKIVGHDQCYPPMTWSCMLHGLKRIDDNLKLAVSRPDYYLDRLGSDVSFLEIDGQLFISTGKHRTTIAKYLAHFNPHKFDFGQIINGVNVVRYEVNHALINQVGELRDKLRKIEFMHLELKWIETSSPFNKNRFMLSNKLRPLQASLLFEEGGLDEIFEMLCSSKSFWSAMRSEKINYLRRPLSESLIF